MLAVAWSPHHCDLGIAVIDRSIIEGAVALGISRPARIGKVALPAAARGIFAGTILGLARAIGETMAVVMVCGNIARIPHSLFDPVRPITSTIALEMSYATADHKSLIYLAGLVLVGVTCLLLVFRIWKEPKGESR